MKNKEKNQRTGRQASVEEWCLGEGKKYIEDLQKEADLVVEILKKAHSIDPKDLQKPCTI